LLQYFGCELQYAARLQQLGSMRRTALEPAVSKFKNQNSVSTSNANTLTALKRGLMVSGAPLTSTLIPLSFLEAAKIPPNNQNQAPVAK